MRNSLKHVVLLNSGGFSPTQISGLLLWADGKDASTLPDGVGNPATTWNDKSGNGNNLTQGTASLQPTVAADGISLDGTEYMSASIPYLTGDVDFSILAVATRDASASFDAGGLWSQPSTSHGMLNRAVAAQYRGDASNLLSAVPGVANSVSHIVSLTKTAGASSTSNTDIHISGTQKILTGPGGLTPNWGGNIRIGEWFASAFRWHGTIHEVLVYDNKLAGVNLDNVHDYLLARWGI